MSSRIMQLRSITKGTREQHLVWSYSWEHPFKNDPDKEIKKDPSVFFFFFFCRRSKNLNSCAERKKKKKDRERKERKGKTDG